MGMSDNWKSFAPQYAALGYQVHLLDLRNHGKSFHSDAFNYEVMGRIWRAEHTLAKQAAPCLYLFIFGNI